MELVIQSFKDLFRAKMLKFAIIPFIVIAAVSYVVFFAVAGAGLDHLTHLEMHKSETVVIDGVPHTQQKDIVLEDDANAGLVQKLLTWAATSWILSSMLYLIGGFIVLYFSLFFSIFIIGFLTPYIVKELHVMHYPNVELVGFGSVAESVFLTLKWAFVMIGLFVLFVPLYFIPVVNIIALNFPLYYFFHKMINYDVASSIVSKEEFFIIQGTKANELRLKTLFLYLLSLIPYAVLFITVYYVIYYGHSYFRYALELRKTPNEVVANGEMTRLKR